MDGAFSSFNRLAVFTPAFSLENVNAAVQKMNWILIPVCSFLYRYGGYKNKDWRRLGIPIVLTSAIMLKDFSLWYFLILAAYGVILRLPFTIVGEDIDDSILNWLWIPFWSILLPSPVLFIPNNAVWPNILASFVIAVFALLSNLKRTRYTFTWDKCEVVFGAMIALPLAGNLS